MRKNKGFAIGIFLVTFLVLGSVCSSMIYIASRDNYSSRQSNIKIETRLLASTASNYFFSKVVSDNQYIDSLINCSTSSDLAINCISTQDKWATINEKGVQVPCPTTSNLKCYQVRIKVLNRSSNPSARDTVRVSIKTKICPMNSKILTDPTYVDKCRYTTYHQVFRKKQYYDYLYFANSIQLDPLSGFFNDPLPIAGCPNSSDKASLRVDPNCYNVAFSSTDIVDGPLRTNDDYFSYCGSPNISINIPVVVTGAGGTNGFKQDSGCNAVPGTRPLTTKQTELPLPSTRSYDQAVSDLGIGKATGCSPSNFSGVSSIVLKDLTSNTTQISDANNGVLLCSISDNGLVTVPNSIELKGVTAGNLTIIVDGNIKIIGDLTYRNGAVTSNTSDLLTLYSTGKITIAKLSSSDTAGSRVVSALLLSTGKAIETENWWSNDASYKTGNLDLFGAIAGNYMPVFSSRDEATGLIIAGYNKSFRYDDRLKSKISPYYALSPENPLWEKLNLAEVASNK